MSTINLITTCKSTLARCILCFFLWRREGGREGGRREGGRKGGREGGGRRRKEGESGEGGGRKGGTRELVYVIRSTNTTLYFHSHEKRNVLYVAMYHKVIIKF